MKFLKYLLFLLLIAVIGFSVYIAVQPSHFDFSRSRVIKAPKSLVFDKVNDFKNWPEFSPWLEKEPNASLTYGEKTSGVNGNYSWVGEILGEGSMSTISVDEEKSIAQHIKFIKPFESESNINWDFKDTDEGTRVTWNMSGEQDFITKMYTTFAGSIEDNTAPDFERGLFKLDSIVVNSMKAYSIKVDGQTEYGGGFYLYKTTSANSSNISAVMGEQFGAVMGYAIKNNISPNGMPFTIYENMNPENGGVIMSQAIPVPSKVTVIDSDNILSGFIPKIKVLKTTLKGNYTYLPEAWTATMKYLSDNNLEQTEIKPFEIYTTDPDNYPNPADWVTEIYIPIK